MRFKFVHKQLNYNVMGLLHTCKFLIELFVVTFLTTSKSDLFSDTEVCILHLTFSSNNGSEGRFLHVQRRCIQKFTASKFPTSKSQENRLPFRQNTRVSFSFLFIKMADWKATDHYFLEKNNWVYLLLKKIWYFCKQVLVFYVKVKVTESWLNPSFSKIKLMPNSLFVIDGVPKGSTAGN